MVGTKFAAPRGGGSARRALDYFLCEEAAQKVTHELARDNPIAPEQYAALTRLYGETDAREDLGVGVIFEPKCQDGLRPAAILFEGVTAVSTAGQELDAIAKTQSRLGAPIDHLGFSHSTEQSKTITNEQVINAARDVVKRVYGEGHAAAYIVHRDTLVWQAAEDRDLYVSGRLVDGVVRDAKRVQGQMVDGKFERVMGPKGRPLPGVPLGRDVVAGSLVDGNVHVHCAIGVLHRETMKARSLSHFFTRLHDALRHTEIKFDLMSDFGLSTIRDRGLATQRVERTSAKDFGARHRERDDERLAERCRAFISDECGLENEQTRTERVQNDLRKYLDGVAARGEKPLLSDVHNIAAALAVTIERGEDGKLAWRLMERAGSGNVSGEWVDEFGERHIRQARWEPTTTLLGVDVNAIAPSPADGGSRKLTKHEREKHQAALDRRAWIERLGDTTAAQAEIRDVVLNDPGRVTRDIVNGDGLANFTPQEITSWMQSHITQPVDEDGWKQLTDYVIRDERSHIAVLSNITEQPLYTTVEHKELSEKYVALASRMMGEEDPTYNRELLDAAVEEEQAIIRARNPNAAEPFTFSGEQVAACHAAASHRYTALEANAGAGKTQSMAILDNYMRRLQRHTHGFSTAQRAAEVLQKESGVAAINEARADTLRTHAGVETVQPKSFNILEEGSMISLRAAYTLLERVDQQGASAMKIGDRSQLSAIEAGDPFALDLHVALKAGRELKLTDVYRQKGPEVAWLLEWIPKMGEAIRTQDQAAFRVCVQEFIERGHVKFYGHRKEMIAGIAEDIVDAIGRGVNVIAPQRAKNDVRFVNAAVFDALGFAGTGLTFDLIDGKRELANGVRVVFKKNSLRSPFREEKDQLIHFVRRADPSVGDGGGVLNGYTGTVTGVSKRSVTVDLDNGDTIRFDPHEYPHLDYGWSATVHVYQGSKSPLVVQGVGKSDDAHSFHTAATRCVDGLHQHSMLRPEELVERLSASRSLAGPLDAMLYQQIVDATGGPDTVWAKHVKSAAKDASDPLRQRHRSAMRQRTEDRDRQLVDILRTQPKRTVARDREVAKLFDDRKLETFVTWAAREKNALEEEWARREQAQRVVPQPVVSQARTLPEILIRRAELDVEIDRQHAIKLQAGAQSRSATDPQERRAAMEREQAAGRTESQLVDEDLRLGHLERDLQQKADAHRHNLTIARSACFPLTDTKGAEYLAGRGLAKAGHNMTSSVDVRFAKNWPEGVTTNAGTVTRGHGPAVVFQFRNPAGDVVAAQGRFIEPPVFDGKPLKVWTVGAIGDGIFWTPGARDAKTLAVCEAPIDALSLAAAGLPAIALGGTQNQPAFLTDLLAGRKVVLALDNDAPGLAATVKLEDMLSAKSETTRLILPPGIKGARIKDVSEALQQVPDALRHAVQTAVHPPERTQQQRSVEDWAADRALELSIAEMTKKRPIQREGPSMGLGR